MLCQDLGTAVGHKRDCFPGLACPSHAWPNTRDPEIAAVKNTHTPVINRAPARLTPAYIRPNPVPHEQLPDYQEQALPTPPREKRFGNYRQAQITTYYSLSLSLSTRITDTLVTCYARGV
jgi:hypothetical protein